MLKSRVYSVCREAGSENPIQECEMARITVEDCLQKVNNRFALIHMAAKRVRQLRKGADPTLTSKNKDVVVSLREIAAGAVIKASPVDAEALLDTRPDSLAEELLAEAEDGGEKGEKAEEIAEEDRKEAQETES
jgi:DNA-directed RNA polymerase subunit omega